LKLDVLQKRYSLEMKKNFELDGNGKEKEKEE
jgi:hypothetical protein